MNPSDAHVLILSGLDGEPPNSLAACERIERSLFAGIPGGSTTVEWQVEA